MQLRIKKYFFLVTILLVCVMLVGCKREAKTLRELSYDVSKKADNEIYIKEKGIFTPYLVLTENYEGGVIT